MTTATVYLVGAGPGDPQLLTRRALDLIRSADVIVHDRLLAAEVLSEATPDAQIVDVGKQPGNPSVGQDVINELLIEHAREGKQVVRLKGGDPFVFGRGGEEALALADAGIAFEVVPAVTAAVGASSYAGIPLTQRGLTSAVAFVTGHEDPSKPDSSLDWDGLANFPGTLVFYMGVRALPRISEQLVAAGRSACEPTAVVENATYPQQRVIVAPLDQIAHQATSVEISNPAVTIIGEVVALRDQLNWFEQRPLHALSITVTRARSEASAIAHELRQLGAQVHEAPAIKIRSLNAELPDLKDYDLVCITSPNGVREFFSSLERSGGRDARALAGCRVAVIGPGTARTLKEHGISADVVAKRSMAEGLLEALDDVEVKRALVARGKSGRDTLPDGLQQRGATVDVVALYETVAEELSAKQREQAVSTDYITFTSASTVHNFIAAVGHDQISPHQRLASIGPATSAALREYGLRPTVEAAQHTPAGLIEAMVADAHR